MLLEPLLELGQRGNRYWTLYLGHDRIARALTCPRLASDFVEAQELVSTPNETHDQASPRCFAARVVEVGDDRVLDGHVLLSTHQAAECFPRTHDSNTEHTAGEVS